MRGEGGIFFIFLHVQQIILGDKIPQGLVTGLVTEAEQLFFQKEWGEASCKHVWAKCHPSELIQSIELGSCWRAGSDSRAPVLGFNGQAWGQVCNWTLQRDVVALAPWTLRIADMALGNCLSLGCSPSCSPRWSVQIAGGVLLHLRSLLAAVELIPRSDFSEGLSRPRTGLCLWLT